MDHKHHINMRFLTSLSLFIFTLLIHIPTTTSIRTPSLKLKARNLTPPNFAYENQYLTYWRRDLDGFLEPVIGSTNPSASTPPQICYLNGTAKDFLIRDLGVIFPDLAGTGKLYTFFSHYDNIGYPYMNMGFYPDNLFWGDNPLPGFYLDTKLRLNYNATSAKSFYGEWSTFLLYWGC